MQHVHSFLFISPKLTAAVRSTSQRLLRMKQASASSILEKEDKPVTFQQNTFVDLCFTVYSLVCLQKQNTEKV